MNAPVIQVHFKGRRHFENLGQCLEREAESGKFYARIKLHRGNEPKQFPLRRTRIAIPGTTENAARKNLTRLLDQFDQFQLGRADNPFATVSGKLSVQELAEIYLRAGCPKRDGKPREGKQLSEEQRRVGYLTQYFGSKPHNAVTIEDWRRYKRSREETRERKNCSGDRAIDLEKKTWDAIFRVAQLHRSTTGVAGNPLPPIRFHHADQVRHARDVMPASGDELHAIAEHLFLSSAESQTLAWLMLYQAKIGHRIGTMLELRRDAAAGEPGYLERNEKGIPKIIYLVRRRTHKGTHGHRRVDSELRDLVEAHFAWLNEKFPTSPWYFPSSIDPTRHVDESSLTGAEERACKALGIPKRTSHGNRAFSINCLRSDRTADGFQKIPDAEIAVLHGQKSAKEIIEVYGDAPPARLTWKPKDRPLAWELLTITRPVQLELGL